MAGECPEAAYAAWLLERQDALQTEANQLVESLDLPWMLGGAGRFERLGIRVDGMAGPRRRCFLLCSASI